MKILHITEAYGGGVTSAINSYVKASNSHKHYLIAVKRPSDATGEEDSELYEDTAFLEKNMLIIKQFQNAVKKIEPDVYHIHSTFAGFFCRFFSLVPVEKSIYTPHGYSFLRNQSKLISKLYYFVEKILANKTKIVAACSQDEKNKADSLRGKTDSITLTNICDDIEIEPPKINSNRIAKIGMVGRVCPQKDFIFFAQVAREFSVDVEFIWIGGGQEKDVEYLKRNNVNVTGWLNRKEVLSILNTLDLYFHTAAWEGFPISVLEAAYLKKPILLRGISSFKAENLSCVDTTSEGIQAIQNWLLQDPEFVELMNRNTIAINNIHSRDNLVQALSDLYNNF